MPLPEYSSKNSARVNFPFPLHEMTSDQKPADRKGKFPRAQVQPADTDMPNAASILRVSTKKQLNEGEGIENQRRGNTDYIRRRGYRLVREFVIAESADGHERQDFEAALAEIVARKAEIDVVVFWKVDRISRGGVVPYFTLKALLAKHEIRVEYATEQIDASPTGELMETLLAGMARFENRVRVDRTIGTEMILAKDGYWCRAAPTGFRNGRRDGKPVLLPCEDAGQWELLRYGLKRQLAGTHTAAQVAAELRRRGFRGKYGRPIGNQAWSNICRSSVYGGLICEKWTNREMVRAKFDGPLTPDEWVRLQHVLDGRQRVALQAPRQTLHPDLPLRRFLRCPACGRPARGYRTVKRNGSTFDYYDCQRAECRFRVRAGDAHTAFVALLRRVTPAEDLLNLFREAVRLAWAEGREAARAGGAAKQQAIAAMEEEKGQLVTLMKRSASKASLLADLERDYARVERELGMARLADEGSVFDRYEPGEVTEVCVGAILHLYELWDRWPVEAQNRIQRLVFPDGLRHDELLGNRTPTLSLLYAIISGSENRQSKMAPPSGWLTNALIWTMIAWYEAFRELLNSDPPQMEEKKDDAVHSVRTVRRVTI